MSLRVKAGIDLEELKKYGFKTGKEWADAGERCLAGIGYAYQHEWYYTSSDRDKRKKMSNPYETPEQEKRRRETEIPLSNLNSYQRVQFKQVGGSYTEHGEFDL